MHKMHRLLRWRAKRLTVTERNSISNKSDRNLKIRMPHKWVRAKRKRDSKLQKATTEIVAWFPLLINWRIAKEQNNSYCRIAGHWTQNSTPPPLVLTFNIVCFIFIVFILSLFCCPFFCALHTCVLCLLYTYSVVSVSVSV